MADTPPTPTHADRAPDDAVRLEGRLDTVHSLLLPAAAVGLIGALVVSYLGFGGTRRFFLSYLLAYSFTLSLGVGGLFFVLLQHATKAGWSVAVRRVPEAMAGSFLPLVALALPLLIPTIFVTGEVELDEAYEGGVASGIFEEWPTLYPWATGPQTQIAAEYGDDYAQAVSDDEVAANDGTPDDVEKDLVGEGEADNVVTADQADGDDHHDEAHHDEAHAAGGHHEPADAYTLLTQTATNEAVFAHFQYDEYHAKKAPYLNWPFWTGRLLLCLGILAVIGGWYWSKSVESDTASDEVVADNATKMRRYSYVALLLFAGAVTVLSWDLLMTLDPDWYSTIFGPYFFAGSAVAVFAVMAIFYASARENGVLGKSVTIEHLHDVGKLLFAFTFFWGYMAFSQYMLIWYAALAESSTWFARRGATTVSENLSILSPGDGVYAAGFWTIISAALLVGHLLIPFLGLLSRHVKRRPKLLAFWGVWLLIFHWVDFYWLIMPELPGGLFTRIPVTELLATVGIAGIWGYFVLAKLKAHALIPLRDPRLPESLAFHNI